MAVSRTTAQQPWSALKPLADPATATGPVTATVADPDIAPLSPAPTPSLPATVTDAQGTKVTVTSTARVLALDLYGTTAGTVQALGFGGHLVGRDTSTGFAAAQHLPVVTADGHQLSAEAILALHPTLLITDTTLGPFDAVLQVRRAGVPVVIVDSHRSLQDTATIDEQVAAALGVPAAGRALTASIDAQLAAVGKHIAAVAGTSKPRVAFLYARGQAGVYYLFGKGSGVDSLLTALHVDDVATDNHLAGFTPLTAEALAKLRPDVLLMMTDGLASVGGVSGALKLPGVAETPAGQHRRIIDMSDYQILSFGPLAPRVLDALARAIYTQP